MQIWGGVEYVCDYMTTSPKQVGFPGGAAVKNPPVNAGDAGDMGSIPALGRSPGKGNGNLLQYSCLENPMDRGAWQVIVSGVAESLTRLSMHVLNYSKAWRYSNGLTYLKNTNQKHSIQQNIGTHTKKFIKPKRKSKHFKKRTKKKQIITWKTRFKKAINTYLSIITLNVSGLNAPMGRYRVADWIKKKKKNKIL